MVVVQRFPRRYTRGMQVTTARSVAPVPESDPTGIGSVLPLVTGSFGAPREAPQASRVSRAGPGRRASGNGVADADGQATGLVAALAPAVDEEAHGKLVALVGQVERRRRGTGRISFNLAARGSFLMAASRAIQCQPQGDTAHRGRNSTRLRMSSGFMSEAISTRSRIAAPMVIRN